MLARERIEVIDLQASSEGTSETILYSVWTKRKSYIR